MAQSESSGRAAAALWGVGPTRPVLRGEEVHVWRVELGGLGDRGAYAALGAEERERAATIVPAERRLRWVRSRAVLRELLGRYLQEDPRALRFLRGAGGKPALASSAARPRFSVSHSGACALYALAADREVGVDVQTRAPARDLLAVAGRAFPAATSERLRSLDPQTRRAAFLAEWVRHEAELKCLGLGLEGAQRLAERELWSVVLPLAAPGAAAALAVEGSAGPLRCWRWTP